LKPLKLNKKSVSELNAHHSKGGRWFLSVPCGMQIIVGVIVSIANDYEGNCVQTWRDPGCPTG
jgi:hypothetical protein